MVYSIVMQSGVCLVWSDKKVNRQKFKNTINCAVHLKALFGGFFRTSLLRYFLKKNSELIFKILIYYFIGEYMKAWYKGSVSLR